MFASREDAGLKLGEYLQREAVAADVVLALPRGGVAVGAAVAEVLRVPLDVLIVRKIGHPWHREFAVGAVAEGGVVVLDEVARASNFLVRREIRDIIAEEEERLREYQAKFRPGGGGPVPVAGKNVVVVDDGLATGATSEAAVQVLRQREARSVVVAAPVGSVNAIERLQRVADSVRVLISDPNFEAVGHYYASFTQVTEEQVLELLRNQHSIRQD